MAKPERGPQPQLPGCPAGPASCLAILQASRQIYHESALLFYSLNTLYLSKPQAMLSFLRHLGTEQCGEIRSLHLEDLLVPMPQYSRGYLDYCRSELPYSEHTIAHLSSQRIDKIHPDAKNAVQLLNKRDNLRKIYLDMRPSQTLQYINLCTQIPGFKDREIVFASPARWSVMAPSTRESRSWFDAFLEEGVKKPFSEKTYYAYWGGEEKYRVEVDILPVLPERRTDGEASWRCDRSVDGEI